MRAAAEWYWAELGKSGEREREWQEKGGDGAGVCDIFLELTRGTITAARFQISGYHVPIWEP